MITSIQVLLCSQIARATIAFLVLAILSCSLQWVPL